MKNGIPDSPWAQRLVFAVTFLLAVAAILATTVVIGLFPVPGNPSVPPPAENDSTPPLGASHASTTSSSFPATSPAPVQIIGPDLALAGPPLRLPGPPRSTNAPSFVLINANSQVMQGHDSAQEERWMDIADNPYSDQFVSRFSYQGLHGHIPEVRIRIEPQAPALTGRIEAKGLKPNFAYQIKLRGIFAHRANFETIGYVGRWRLPGIPTNYSDFDYRFASDKSRVEAYIVFDFFVTDRNGCAVREFALDQTLHVLWKTSQLLNQLPPAMVLPADVDASDPSVYATPKPGIERISIWAEPEYYRYRTRNQIIRLPPGEYHAELVLTEESFHCLYPPGGYWATVLSCPIQFTVTPPTLP